MFYDDTIRPALGGLSMASRALYLGLTGQIFLGLMLFLANAALG